MVGAVEQAEGGPIGDWGTALWWALATVTTVGYGDVVPVTTVGRGVGSLLMLVGIGVFGVITANVAAWFVETGSDMSNGQQMEEIRAELEQLRRKL